MRREYDYRYEETDKPTSIIRVILAIGIAALFVLFVLLHWMM